MLNPHPFYNPVRSDREGDVRDCGQHGGGNPDSLDFLGYRCTATVAAASSRDQQHSIDSARLQFLCHLCAEAL